MIMISVRIIIIGKNRAGTDFYFETVAFSRHSGNRAAREIKNPIVGNESDGVVAVAVGILINRLLDPIDKIIALTAVDNISADDRVVARAAVNRILTSDAVDRIITRAAVDRHTVAVFVVDRIVTVTSVQHRVDFALII